MDKVLINISSSNIFLKMLPAQRYYQNSKGVFGCYSKEMVKMICLQVGDEQQARPHELTSKLFCTHALQQINVLFFPDYFYF